MKQNAIMTIAYRTIHVVMISVIVLLLFTFRLERFGAEGSGDVKRLQNYTTYQVARVNDHIPYQKEGYSIEITADMVKGGHLIFYTIHQEAEAIINLEPVYRMRTIGRDFMGKTPGCVWNDIPIYPEQLGKTIQVELGPVYASSVGYVPDFYIGTRAAVMDYIIRKSAPNLLVSLLMVFVGVTLSVISFYNRKNTDYDKNVGILGAFACIVGIWRMVDTAGFAAIFSAGTGVTTLIFSLMALCPIPAILFCWNLCEKNSSKLWLVLIGIDELYLIAIFLLQYLNVFDYREMLWSILGMICVLFVSMAVMIAREVRTNGMTKKIQIAVIGLPICFVGVMVDAVYFFFGDSRENSVIGQFFLLTFVIVEAVISFRENTVLIKEGSSTQSFRDMAYHDQLTGLYNRTAFEKDVDELKEHKEKVAIIDMDLNNLKTCNDTLGHEMGDRYLVGAANIIRECFAGIGNCYRTGGDEFYCIVTGAKKEVCKDRIEKLRKACEDYNRMNPKIDMSIALGYALYEKLTDYDLRDTIKRADKLMYQNKAELKGLKS